LVTRFSTEIGAMTDLGALSERIIQELCRVGGTTHGALYLLDREHEHFRRAGLVGLAAESCFPGTLALTHTIPQHLSSSLQTAPGMTEPHNGCRAALDDALAAMRAGRNLPHVSRGRLIAFSLLGGNRTEDHDATQIMDQPYIIGDVDLEFVQSDQRVLISKVSVHQTFAIEALIK